MGYYRYQVGEAQGYEFKRLAEESLLGCNRGLIARYLRTHPPVGSEPVRWSFEIRDAFQALQLEGNSFIIDLKPEQEGNVSLYEIEKIWGYSNCGWTPTLLHLKAVLVDESSSEYDKTNFSLTHEQFESRRDIYTFLYLRGTISNGQLSGTWLPPGPSPTNSVLLWPEAMDYFAEEMGYLRARRPMNPGV